MSFKSGCRLTTFVFIAGLTFAGCAGMKKAPDHRDDLLAKAEKGDQQAQYELAKTYCCGLGMRTSGANPAPP